MKLPTILGVVVAAITNLAPAHAADGNGKMELCLDEGFQLSGDETQSLPAGILLEYINLNDKGPKHNNLWVATVDPVVLSAKAPCGTVGVTLKHDVLDKDPLPPKVSAPLEGFYGEGVLNYKSSSIKSKYDDSNLIFSEKITGKLLSDVSSQMKEPVAVTQEDATATCEDLSQKLANQFHTSIRSDVFPLIYSEEWKENGYPLSFSLMCYGDESAPGPSVQFDSNWSDSGHPNPSAAYWAAKDASSVLGSTPQKIQKAIGDCVDEALKPESKEMATIYSEGIGIECQAFERDGGGGAVTIYRKAGTAAN